MFKTYKFFTILFIFISCSITLAQNTLSGTVSDAVTGEKLIGANVYIADQGIGSTTNVEGSYFINNVKEGIYQITVSYIGYVKLNKNVKISGATKLNFTLDPSSVLLEETVVKGTKAVLRETPIAFSEIKGEDLEFRLASRDIPQELLSTPSVYSSEQGGGSGDATLFIRGFSQRNVAVMVNGVPVNDMESHWVYWSDYSGLGDVLDETQVQRGIGASPYSINAVGGVMNMTTKGMGSDEEYYKIKSEYGSNNLIKNSVSFHQKVLGGIDVTALFSKKNWDGYAIGTYAKDYTYFISAGGVFGNHSLQLTVVGSPQEHGQRPYNYARMTIADWAKYGHNFNYAMGRLKGSWFNETVNNFHNPQFNLNWNWQLAKKTTLSTVAYYSLGNGYGSGTLGPFAPAIASGDFANYRDYDKVWSINSTTVDNKFSTTLHRSTSTVLRNAVNNHYWSGLLSTLKTELSPELILNVGIDGRYYIGDHYQEIRDLIGGDYYVDSKDINNINRMAVVGDKVGYYDDFYVRQFGGFGQLEYKFGDFVSFVNLSASTQGAKRKDFFLYKSDDPFNTSDWQNFFGYTAKGGLNYNLDDNNQIFFNTGYFSTAPLVGNIFANNTNVVSKDAKNEKVFILELGYSISTNFLNLKANGFYTKWKDRAITVSYSDIDPASGDPVTKYANISGSDQQHTGAELESVLKIMKGLELKLNGSYVVGKYLNDVTATISPDNNPTAIKITNLYVKDLYVSEFPQQQVNLQLNYRFKLFSGLNVYVNPEYQFMGKYYSFFNPDTRNNATDRTQSWQIPDRNIVNFHLGFSYFLTDFVIKKINLNFHVFNFLNNSNYIVDAQDGGTNPNNHNDTTAKVFYGRERWFNVTAAFTF